MIRGVHLERVIRGEVGSLIEGDQGEDGVTYTRLSGGRGSLIEGYCPCTNVVWG